MTRGLEVEKDNAKKFSLIKRTPIRGIEPRAAA